MFGLEPVVVPSLEAAMGVRGVLVETGVKNLRSEMQSEAISMERFTFVSLVGTEDWLARNQVSSSPTFFLNVVPVLQVECRPTQLNVRREKRNFGRLRQRPRGLHRNENSS
jgi:hypothetical protein